MAIAASELEFENLLELEDEGELEGEFGEFEDEFEDEFEGELEGELEFEFEDEISPVRKYYADAMLEHMGHAAAEAESEDEAAEGFLPLIPMLAGAGKLVGTLGKLGSTAGKLAGGVGKLGKIGQLASRAGRVTNSLTRVTPRLTKGVTNITKVLHRNPRTRPLVRAVPTIARRTVKTLAKQAASGQPVTPQKANRVLAAHARRVLRNPKQAAQVLRRSRRLDKHLHRVSGGTVKPHYKLRGVIGRALSGAGRRAISRLGGGVINRLGGAVTRLGTPIGAGGIAAAAGGCGACVCPTCGATPSRAAAAVGASAPVAAAPAYCRCCGQVLR